MVTFLGCLAVLSFVAQAVGVLTNFYNQFAPREHAKPTVPNYVRDGYYVEDRQTIWDLGPWRDVSPSERNEKVSLAICYGYFTIHREKEEAKNFVHRISSTANVEPEVFGNRTFEKLPVEGFDKVGGVEVIPEKDDIAHTDRLMKGLIRNVEPNFPDSQNAFIILGRITARLKFGFRGGSL